MGGGVHQHFPTAQIQTDTAMKGGRVVVVVDARVYTTRHARHEIEPVCRVQSKERAGVIEWNGEVEDVGMRIENVGSRIDRLGAFQRYPLADLQIKPAFGQDREMQVEIRFGNVRLIKTAA